MVEFKRHDIDARYLRSLAWQGGELKDIIGGGDIYHLDGTSEDVNPSRVYAYPFDSIFTCGRYAVIYEALGTKGLLIDMDKQEVLRELNRSYYHAKDYAYPIAMLTLPGGQDAIIHCPVEYENLEIEDRVVPART